jgi:hypothetical protein
MLHRVIVSATMAIYIATGIKIVRKGALLRFFANESQQGSQNRDSATVETIVKPISADKRIVVTTQIEHDVHHHDTGSRCASSDDDRASLSSYSSTKNLSRSGRREEIEVVALDQSRTACMSHDLKPSDATRGSPHHHDSDSKTSYRATVYATNDGAESAALPPRPASSATHHQNSHIKRAAGNEAAVAYLKVAFLMFVALIVVWVPSSVNRLYQFIHLNQPNFPLSLISAVVLPMQGVWNATIYTYTTRAEYRRAYSLLQSKVTGRSVPYHQSRDLYHKDTLTSSMDSKSTNPEIQLEEGVVQGDRLRQSESA